jgi:hypothetical protein
VNWYQTMGGDWITDEHTIAARLAETFVNGHFTVEWLENILDKKIEEFGIEVFR